MDYIECKGKTVDEAVFSGLFKMDLSIDEVEIEILDEGGSFFKSAKVRLTKKKEEAAEPPYKAAVLEDKPAVHANTERQQDAPRMQPRDTRQDGGRRNERGNDSRHGEGRRDSRRDEHRRDDHRQEDYRRSEVGIPADFVAQEPSNEAEKFLLGLFERMSLGVKLKSENEEGILKVDLSGRSMGMLIGRRGETLDALQYLTSLVVNNGKEEYTKIMLDTEDYRKKREDTLRRLAARLADKVQKSGKRVVLEPMNPYERRILHSTLQDYPKVYTYSEGEDPFRSVVVALKGKDDQAPNTGETKR